MLPFPTTQLTQRGSPVSDLGCLSLDTAIVEPYPSRSHARHRYFSVKMRSVMHRSSLNCRVSVDTVYLTLTDLKNMARTKLCLTSASVRSPLGTWVIASVLPSPMATTVLCLDRSRSMRPTSVGRRRINMPPNGTGSGVWVENTQSSASSFGRPVKFAPNPSTIRRWMSNSDIRMRTPTPMRPCVRMRCEATRICSNHTKPSSTALANMSGAVSSALDHSGRR